MKYIKFGCMPDEDLPTISGVDQAYRLGNYGVWKAEDEFIFPESPITTNLCIRKELSYKDMSTVEINMYENYLATVSG